MGEEINSSRRVYVYVMAMYEIVRLRCPREDNYIGYFTYDDMMQIRPLLRVRRLFNFLQRFLHTCMLMKNVIII